MMKIMKHTVTLITIVRLILQLFLVDSPESCAFTGEGAAFKATV